MNNQQRLLDQLTVMLREEFGDDLLGILATGSRIHGTPGPTSDVDLHVIIAPPRRQRRNIVLGGVEIEMFINPPFQIRRYFGSGMDEHMFTFGRAIYDPQGVVAALQEEARARWEAGPPAIGPNDWRHRYIPADGLRDLEDIAASDEATANMLIAQIVGGLIESHYQLNGRWPEKPKRRLADVARWDGPAAQLARDALTCQPLERRRAALEQLAAHVLAPLGGLMPLEWRMEWEEVQP